jgi:hypothetical protein
VRRQRKRDGALDSIFKGFIQSAADVRALQISPESMNSAESGKITRKYDDRKRPLRLISLRFTNSISEVQFNHEKNSFDFRPALRRDSGGDVIRHVALR